MENTSESKALPARLIFYDGVCGLCHGFVRFVLRWDRRQRFYFAPLQGGLAKEVLLAHGVQSGRLESIALLLDGGKAWGRLSLRSDAVIAVMRGLRQPMPMLARCLGWFPVGLRDWIYDVVARHRYKVFGKVVAEGEVCPLPSSTQGHRFL
jgi:predicted DCC family thiol-disulfide oxidoreductase YuxK